MGSLLERVALSVLFWLAPSLAAAHGLPLVCDQLNIAVGGVMCITAAELKVYSQADCTSPSTWCDAAAEDVLCVDTVDDSLYRCASGSVVTLFVDPALGVHEALTAAHGATGAVVGTTNSQTLTNKTLTDPTIGATGFVNANHAHAAANSGGTVAHSALTEIGTNTHAQIDSHIAASGPSQVFMNGAGTVFGTHTGVNFAVGDFTAIEVDACIGGTNEWTACPLGTECTGGGVCTTDARLDVVAHTDIYRKSMTIDSADLPGCVTGCP